MGIKESSEKWEREHQRKEEALRKRLASLRDDGDETAHSRNAMIADIHTADEQGDFTDEEQAKDFRERLSASHEDRSLGFLIRARRDAFHATLNTKDILTQLDQLMVRFTRLERLVEMLLALAVAWTVVAVVRHFSG